MVLESQPNLLLRTFVETELKLLSDDNRLVLLRTLDQHAKLYISKSYVKPW